MKNKSWKYWSTRGCGLALVAMMAVGCSSMEDRITNVVTHELEQCREAEEDFYTVSASGGEYDILVEACKAELGEVEMDTDYRGVVSSGPLLWTAREDGQSIVIKRVGWYALDRALEFADRSDPDEDQLQQAEEYFARAQDEYADSLWVRQRRLENLVELRGEEISADTEDVVGDALRDYLDEFVAWTEEQEDTEAAAQARLTVVSHLQDYIGNQERSIERLGSGDERMRAAAQHAEDDGDLEEAREIRADLEQRIDERPEREELLQGRITNAERQKCDITDGLYVDGVDDGVMREQITSLVGDRDCDFDDDEEVASNGDE